MSETKSMGASEQGSAVQTDCVVGDGHVFISHSHEDGVHFARELAQWLEDNGISIWLDDKIKGGKIYDRTIEEAIRASSAVIVVVTEDVGRPDSFVRKEIQYALNHRKPLVPVRLADVPIPILLATHQWISEEDALGQKILASLRSATDPADSPTGRRALKTRRWSRGLTAFVVAVVVTIAAAVILWSRTSDIPVRDESDQRNPAAANFSDELRPHLEILETRASAIAREILDLNDRQRFEELHRKNVKALESGKIMLAHEMTRQIRDLLDRLPVPVTVYRPDFSSHDDDHAFIMSRNPPTALSLADRYPFFRVDDQLPPDSLAETNSPHPLSRLGPQGVNMPHDDDPMEKPSLGPADSPPSLLPETGPDDDPMEKPSLDPADVPPRLASETGPDHAAARKELIQLLDQCAVTIERVIRGRFAEDPLGEALRTEFLSLHKQNMDALRAGNLVLHRDLSEQIHELLHQVYHVVYRPIIGDDGSATLLDAMMHRYPTLDGFRDVPALFLPAERE